MKLTITLTIGQASALIHAIKTVLHIAAQSPNTAMAYGVDLRRIQLMNSAMDNISNAIPEPTQTNESCTPPPTTSSASTAS